jgi:hypothetical protein
VRQQASNARLPSFVGRSRAFPQEENMDKTIEECEEHKVKITRLNHPHDGKLWYFCEVGGVKFNVGEFATLEEADAAIEANLPNYLTRLAPKPPYRVEKLGTVTIDTGTLMLLDPCRINALAATQDRDGFLDSPLYPDDYLRPNTRADDSVLSKQILDPATPAKVPDPQKLSDYGTTAGNALSLHTGLGDGEYTVTAEIVNYGGLWGERIAAIHIRFVDAADIAEAKRAVKAGKDATAGE